MTLSKPELVIFSPDAELIAKLKPFSLDLTYILYEVGYGPEVVRNAQLDAIWTSPMAGAEIFGASPPFPVHEARIYESPPGAQKSGMPRYGIVGVATWPDDPTTPEFNLRLVVTALLREVRSFNATHPLSIQRVGILPEDLDLKRFMSRRAFEIVQEVYENT